MLSVRPKVADLAFHLYGRSLHPELFEVHKTKVIDRGGYAARIDITSAGHVITWRYDGLTLTEVAASAQHPLPQKRRLLSHTLRGLKDDRVKCRGGIKYFVKLELESVDPSVFWNLQDKLTSEGLDGGVLHTFDASGRLALGAVSFVNVETRSRSMSVQAFHTFPDDYAILKIQSDFELP